MDSQEHSAKDKTGFSFAVETAEIKQDEITWGCFYPDGSFQPQDRAEPAAKEKS
jgi:hypothetical protein